MRVITRSLLLSLLVFLVPVAHALLKPSFIAWGMYPYKGNFIGIDFRTDGSAYNPYDDVLDTPDANLGIATDADPPDNTLQYRRLGILPPVGRLADADPLASSDRGVIGDQLRRGVAAIPTDYDRDGVSETTSLVGHSTDWYPHRYSTVFASLGQARIGDTYELTLDGETHSYRVVEIHQIDPTDTEYLAQLEAASTGDRSLLITCWPLFTTDRRLIVVGDAV